MQQPLSSYEVRYLVSHLMHVGSVLDVHRLFSFENSSQRNYWFLTKESHGEHEGYSNELKSLIETLARNVGGSNHDKRSINVGLLLRYQLLNSVLNGFADVIPSSLLSELVKRGLWGQLAAIDYAFRLTNPKERILALSALLPLIDEESRFRCYEEALRSVTELERIAGTPDTLSLLQNDALSTIGHNLATAGSHSQVVALCYDCQSWRFAGNVSQVEIAADLLRLVPESYPGRAVCASYLCSLSNDETCAAHLLDLLPTVQAHEAVTELLKVLQLGDRLPWQEQEVVSALSRYLGDSSLVDDWVIRLLQRWKNRYPRKVWVQEEARILPLLTGDRRKEATTEILLFVADGHAEDDVLEDLVDRLGGQPDLEKSLLVETVNRIPHGYLRCSLSARILKLMSPEVRDQAISDIWVYMKSAQRRGDSLSLELLLCQLTTQANLLPPDKLTTAAMGIKDGRYRLRAFANFIPHLSPTPLSQVTIEALATLGGYADQRGSGDTLAVKSVREVAEEFFSNSAAYISSEYLTEATHVLRAWDSSMSCLFGITRALDNCNDADKTPIVQWALALLHNCNEVSRSNHLIVLAKYLDEGTRRTALAIAHNLSDTSRWVKSVCAIRQYEHPLHIGGKLDSLFHERLDQLDDPRLRAEALIDMLNALPHFRRRSSCEQLFETIANVEHATNQAHLLRRVGDWCSEQSDTARSTLAFNVIRNQSSAVMRDVWRELAPVLCAKTVKKLLSRLQHRIFRDSTERAALPALFARYAELGHSVGAYLLVKREENSDVLGEALEKTVPFLPGEIINEALPLFKALENNYLRNRAVCALCIRASELGLGPIAENMALSLDRPTERSKALFALSAAAESARCNYLYYEALDSFYKINDVEKGWVLPYLGEALLCCATTDEDLTNRLIVLLSDLANGTPSLFIQSMYTLSPALRRIGGGPLVVEMTHAIADIARWWR